MRIDGKEFDIPVEIGEGLTEILIGLQWLKTRRYLRNLSKRFCNIRSDCILISVKTDVVIEENLTL